MSKICSKYGRKVTWRQCVLECYQSNAIIRHMKPSAESKGHQNQTPTWNNTCKTVTDSFPFHHLITSQSSDQGQQGTVTPKLPVCSTAPKKPMELTDWTQCLCHHYWQVTAPALSWDQTLGTIKWCKCFMFVSDFVMLFSACPVYT